MKTRPLMTLGALVESGLFSVDKEIATLTAATLGGGTVAVHVCIDSAPPYTNFVATGTVLSAGSPTASFSSDGVYKLVPAGVGAAGYVSLQSVRRLGEPPTDRKAIQLLFELVDANFSVAGTTFIPKYAPAGTFDTWKSVNNMSFVLGVSGAHDAAGAWNVNVDTTDGSTGLNLLATTTDAFAVPGGRSYSNNTSALISRYNMYSGPTTGPRLVVTTPMAGTVLATIRLFGFITS